MKVVDGRSSGSSARAGHDEVRRRRAALSTLMPGHRQWPGIQFLVSRGRHGAGRDPGRARAASACSVRAAVACVAQLLPTR
jgi:hypothetical protein